MASWVKLCWQCSHCSMEMSNWKGGEKLYKKSILLEAGNLKEARKVWFKDEVVHKEEMQRAGRENYKTAYWWCHV